MSSTRRHLSRREWLYEFRIGGSELRPPARSGHGESTTYMRVRPLRLQWGMTTSHSIESTSRKIVWGALALFAVASAACGGATQSMAGTAPSSLSAMSGAPDAGGAFGLMKEGKGKGPNGDTPTTPTAPGDDQDGGHGHGHATLQFEGFTSDITGTCPDLTIVINEETIVTNEDTDFQRTECADLKPQTTTTTTISTQTETTPTTTAPEQHAGFHLHIAATMDDEGKLIATYVRMQGPKIGGGEDDDEDTTTPTTPTN